LGEEGKKEEEPACTLCVAPHDQQGQISKRTGEIKKWGKTEGNKKNSQKVETTMSSEH